MKKKIFLSLSLLFLVIACNKDDDTNIKPEDIVLPEATQTGAVMLACKVNGVPYICKGYNQVTSYYQWVDGGYGFIIRGLKKTDFVWSISLGNRGNASMSKGTHPLNEVNPGYWGGGYIKGGPDSYLKVSLTNSTYIGEMTITKFDLANEIVSGTFWFDVQNPWTGEKIEVREGRFDTHFSQ
ncbi:hypothetical protein EG240_05235 [Paenimyroides tangerinum]|jgi:hypothetical protein|uniref:Uncharacterized protein n=2 Tax=Paenimyroides tangerinum TaxID=2488728 RepID=A0A3P3WA60_9FLAO|nr:hypothetical protein [Paenimyroides tangerinum]RRJ91604.1 hypothetical protein EG240_05235 [Paenimyroides tangerinum]